MSRADRRLGVALTLIALAWLWLVDNHVPEVPTEGEPGPRAVPFLLGILLAILGIAVALQPGPKGPGVHAESDVGRVPSGSPRRDGRIAVLTFAMLVVYAFVLDTVGFVASTVGLMVAALAGVLRMRRWVFIAVFAVAFSLGCWVVFNALLGIPLPRGVWVAW
jgi:putative tricarboxylic transport membrane protein